MYLNVIKYFSHSFPPKILVLGEQEGLKTALLQIGGKRAHHWAIVAKSANVNNEKLKSIGKSSARQLIRSAVYIKASEIISFERVHTSNI